MRKTITPRILIVSVILTLLTFSAWAIPPLPGNRLFLEIKGKIQLESDDERPYRVQVVNSDTYDTTMVNLEDGKFDLQLKYESQFLMLVDYNDTVVKQIIVSTTVPMGTSGYKVKMSLDMRPNNGPKRTMGILEFNGFQNKFVIRPMGMSELKRRKYEFEALYSHMTN